VAVFETIDGRETSIGIIDLDDESIETIDLDEPVVLVDAMQTHVIVASRPSRSHPTSTWVTNVLDGPEWEARVNPSGPRADR